MILQKMRVQNLKSIIDTGIIYLSTSDLITILAGQNESGKTSLLRGLKFFEEGVYDTFEDDDERMDTYARVDLTFILTPAELDDVKSATNKKISDYYKKNGFTFVRGDTAKEDNDSIKYTTSDEIKGLIDDYNNGLAEDAEKFNPYKYFSGRRPEFVLYSSFVDNILPGKATYAELEENQAIIDFENVYKINFQKLLDPSTSDQKRTKAVEKIKTQASDSLNTYWNQKVSGEKAEYKYRIGLNPQASLSDSYVNFFVDQGDGMPLKISQKSQGFQWFSGFVLRLRAHQEALESRGIILLIDEPGQGLHEVAQQDVKNVIEEVSKTSNIQIIYSTHQPILLGKDDVDFSRLLLVNRDKDQGSTFKTISQLISSSGSMDALAPVRSAMGLVTITDPTKKSLTVVTEGITELFYLRTFYESKYTILPSAGVDQVPNIFAILYGWGIKTRVVVDDDTQGRKAFHKIKKEFYGGQETDEFKHDVLKITDSEGIENLISVDVISGILSDFGKIYDLSLSKVENVEQVGKMIFAKSFYDKFAKKLSGLDAETKSRFKEIGDFLAA